MISPGPRTADGARSETAETIGFEPFGVSIEGRFAPSSPWFAIMGRIHFAAATGAHLRFRQGGDESGPVHHPM